MKNGSLILLFSIFSISSFSQDERKNHISMGFGGASATGTFSQITEADGSGYAKNGSCNYLQYQRDLNDKWSLVTEFISITNEVDKTALAGKYQKIIKLDNPLTMDAEDYYSQGMLFGVMYKIKKAFYVRMLIGSGSSMFPKQTMTGQFNDLTPLEIRLTSVTSQSSLFKLGIGYDFKMGNRWEFRTNFDLFSASANYNNIPIIDKINSFILNFTSFDIQQTNSLLTIGVGFKL